MNACTQQIDPQTIFQVDLAFMNEDHNEAVKLLNQLNQVLTAGDSKLVDQLISQFYQHNREHFAREEQHMQEYGFPPYPMHKAEHDRVLAEMNAAVAQWQQQQDSEALTLYLNETVVPWFENHLQSMDYVTARFIAMQMQQTR